MYFVVSTNKQCLELGCQSAVFVAAHDANRHAFDFVVFVVPVHFFNCLAEAAVFAGDSFVVAPGALNDHPWVIDVVVPFGVGKFS